MTVGIEGTPDAGAGGAVQNALSPDQNWIIGFEAGGDIVTDDPTGGAWFVTNVYTNGIAGDDLEVLLAQFTTDGELSGTLNYQVFINGDGANDVRVTASFSSADLAGTEAPACGCTDPAADNYDATAQYDDGSCSIAGCTDSAADNFNAAATDEDGSCLYSVAPIRRPSTTTPRPMTTTGPASSSVAPTRGRELRPRGQLRGRHLHPLRLHDFRRRELRSRGHRQRRLLHFRGLHEPVGDQL